MSDERVQAISFESETVESWLGVGGLERATIFHVELENGRTLTVDQDGVYDRHDLPRGDEQVECLFWDEILAALDAKRARRAN